MDYEKIVEKISEKRGSISELLDQIRMEKTNALSLAETELESYKDSIGHLKEMMKQIKKA